MARDENPAHGEPGKPAVILIADDHELIRRSMAEVLHREFASRVLEAGHFDEALGLISTPELYLAIVDLRMPGMQSPLDLARLRHARPDVRVIVLSGSEARLDILAALKAGVHGYIVKSEPTELMITRIRHVLAGEIYVPPCIAEMRGDLAEKTAAPGVSQAHLDVLTPRQREVLHLITEGLSNKEIGRRLGVAEGTVKMHVATILKSIGANNRAHAAAIGRKFLTAIE